MRKINNLGGKTLSRDDYYEFVPNYFEWKTDRDDYKEYLTQIDLWRLLYYNSDDEDINTRTI